MKESTKYVKIVEYSIDDSCYVGSCPGDNEQEVFNQLCLLVDETI